MISGSKAIARINRARGRWRKELPTDFVRGVIHGLTEAVSLVTELHEQSKRAQDSSPFIWKAAVIRKMLKQSMAYILRAERSRGLALIERVLAKGKKV